MNKEIQPADLVPREPAGGPTGARCIGARLLRPLPRSARLARPSAWHSAPERPSGKPGLFGKPDWRKYRSCRPCLHCCGPACRSHCRTARRGEGHPADASHRRRRFSGLSLPATALGMVCLARDASLCTHRALRSVRILDQRLRTAGKARSGARHLFHLAFAGLCTRPVAVLEDWQHGRPALLCRLRHHHGCAHSSAGRLARQPQFRGRRACTFPAFHLRGADSNHGGFRVRRRRNGRVCTVSSFRHTGRLFGSGCGAASHHDRSWQYADADSTWHFSDRISDRRKLLLFCATTGLIGMMALPYLMQHWYFMAGILFLWGGVVAGLYTVGLAHLGSELTGRELASANAAFIFCYAIGMLAGPQLVGIGMDAMGPKGFPMTLGIFFAAYALFAAVRLLLRKKQS
uniref:Multidrug resistance protein n=1 Tax=Brucella abortus TaxID=235 RepID=Q9RF93_BRUAO|nr:multidrug resistance protein [Brucella abortus]